MNKAEIITSAVMYNVVWTKGMLSNPSYIQFNITTFSWGTEGRGGGWRIEIFPSLLAFHSNIFNYGANSFMV